MHCKHTQVLAIHMCITFLGMHVAVYQVAPTGVKRGGPRTPDGSRGFTMGRGTALARGAATVPGSSARAHLAPLPEQPMAG